ncbi:hypothetical protein [Endozoicomonas lisbonensis]|uniref:Primosomal replication protein PriB/PriC domain protein n=1 Tax=Endozoicomonas lisbonensis TaxID=3120522 RepID=A0ABV2SFJ3_9GAMM
MSKEQEMIDRYLQAEMDLLEGKDVSFNGRRMTMENLSEIRQGRHEWERRLQAKKGVKRHSYGKINW